MTQREARPCVNSPFKSIVITVVILLLLPAGAVGGPVLPDFGAATFAPGAPVNNIYFPMPTGVVRTYQGEVDGVVERFELTNLGRPGPTILGVQTTTQRDRAFEDNRIVEETFDYYGQDTAGNVWYFGEDVTNFEYDDAGNLIGTNDSSAWRAGENSGLPGFIMPAALSPGLHYYQEFSPFDAAIDEGQTLAIDRELSLQVGDYSDVMAVLEILATEPDARGIKYYAPGFGLIAEDEGVALDFMSAEARLELIKISAIPVPAALPLFVSALGFLVAASRRRKGDRSPKLRARR